MEDVEQHEGRTKQRWVRSGIAAIALCVAIAGGSAPGVAWAEPTVTDPTPGATTSAEAPDSGSVDTAPVEQPITHEPTTDHQEPAEAPADEKAPAEDPDADVVVDEVEEAPDVTVVPAEPAHPHDTPPLAVPEDVAPPRDSDQQPAEPTVVRVTSESEDAGAAVAVLDPPAEPAAVVDAPQPRTAVAPAAALVTVVTPSAPQPLSPVAELLALPGRIVNAVLQFFNLTSAVGGPHTPFSLAPINDLLFAAFRELERWAGLDRPPAVQPVVPTLTYTGPTTTPTPTVAQFLNAAASGYGLGTVPGGLVPFTVNGFQMTSLNIFNGHAAAAWVTGNGQIIISYQGTTGGTNLLFNPLIAISQILTDLQIIFTGTTPWAFDDALAFARRVQDEAARQGYGADDIFVTGHSLGGWQAEYVAQQLGLAGIGFESPGINTVTPGNGAGSMFVNIETYGDPAPYMSTDLPGLQPFLPPYVAGGGSKPHYGSIVMIGDPAAMTPLLNASTWWGRGLIASFIFMVDFLGNFFQYHLPGIQAYHLDVVPDPGVVPFLGTARGRVHTGYGALTIPQLMQAASDDGILFQP